MPGAATSQTHTRRPAPATGFMARPRVVLAELLEMTSLGDTMTDNADLVHRAMTDDGSFRVLTCDVTRTIAAAIEAQQASGLEATTFGELLVGTILFRETMSPALRVQGIAKAADRTGQFIADSHPSGDVRGLVQRKNAEIPVTLQPGATLCMMRSMQNGSLNQGIVELGEKPTMSEGLMAYMQTSEQIVTMVGVGVDIEKAGQVQRAGGYLVQLLPGAKRGALMVMTERLNDFQDAAKWLTDRAFTPDWLLGELLYGFDFSRVGTSEVRFHCWCDELKVIGALSTLPKSDLEELAQAEEVLSINCDYCGKLYEISPVRLRGLLKQS
jgi:molecular chaperone Hsp33